LQGCEKNAEREAYTEGSGEEKGAGNNDYPTIKKAAGRGMKSLVAGFIVRFINRHFTDDKVFF